MDLVATAFVVKISVVWFPCRPPNLGPEPQNRLSEWTLKVPRSWWRVGEAAAQERLAEFLEAPSPLARYQKKFSDVSYMVSRPLGSQEARQADRFCLPRISAWHCATRGAYDFC